MRSKLHLVLILFLLAPVMPASSQIEEEVQVNVMEVWVKATTKSKHPVTDLQRDDFQVFIDNHPAEITCFENSFAPSDESMAQGEVQRGTGRSTRGRSFVIFFDLLNSLPGDIEFLKRKMSEFIRASFTDEDRAMVFTLLPSTQLGLVQKWTSDKYALMRVIGKMRGNITLSTSLRDNERQLARLLYPPETTQNNNPGEGRGIGPRENEPIDQAKLLAGTYAKQEERRGRTTLAAFRSVADYLSDMTGGERQVLLYVSGGFSFRPGEAYYSMVERAVEERYTAEMPEHMGLHDYPSIDFAHEIRNAMGVLNRLNVTVYSLDTAGLVSGGSDATRDTTQASKGLDLAMMNRDMQDSLVYVAHETGGTALINTQDYGRGLNEIVRDIGEQYSLCVTLPAQHKRGAFHKIEVKVSRPDIKLRHRSGYIE